MVWAVGMGDLTLILAKHSQVLRDTLNQMGKVFKSNLYVSPIIKYYVTLFNAIYTSWRSVHQQPTWAAAGCYN